MSRLEEQDRQKVTTVMTDYQVSLQFKIGAVTAHKTTVATASRNEAMRPNILDDAGQANEPALLTNAGEE